jgi:hypothetical protein
MTFIAILVIIFSYLLGSIPSAVIVSRLTRGVDIRTLGDGNMGARNTYRTFGLAAGLAVALADGCKGALSVLLARWLGLPAAWQTAAAVAAVLGHDFPVFAHFRGGQGLAQLVWSPLPDHPPFGSQRRHWLRLDLWAAPLSAALGVGSFHCPDVPHHPADEVADIPSAGKG